MNNVNSRVTQEKCYGLHLGTGVKCTLYTFWEEGLYRPLTSWHVKTLNMMEVTKWKSN